MVTEVVSPQERAAQVLLASKRSGKMVIRELKNPGDWMITRYKGVSSEEMCFAAIDPRHSDYYTTLSTLVNRLNRLVDQRTAKSYDFGRIIDAGKDSHLIGVFLPPTSWDNIRIIHDTLHLKD